MKIDILIYQIFDMYHAAYTHPGHEEITTDTNLAFMGAFIEMGYKIRDTYNIGIMDRCHELTIKLIHT